MMDGRLAKQQKVCADPRGHENQDGRNAGWAAEPPFRKSARKKKDWIESAEDREKLGSSLHGITSEKFN